MGKNRVLNSYTCTLTLQHKCLSLKIYLNVILRKCYHIYFGDQWTFL